MPANKVSRKPLSTACCCPASVSSFCALETNMVLSARNLRLLFNRMTSSLVFLKLFCKSFTLLPTAKLEKFSLADANLSRAGPRALTIPSTVLGPFPAIMSSFLMNS